MMGTSLKRRQRRYYMIYLNIMSDEYTVPYIWNLCRENLVIVGDSNHPREDLSRVL